MTVVLKTFSQNTYYCDEHDDPKTLIDQIVEARVGSRGEVWVNTRGGVAVSLDHVEAIMLGARSSHLSTERDTEEV